MKNTGPDTAQIIWTAREDSIGFNPFVLHNSKHLKFTLPPSQQNELKLTFGEGAWTEDYINSFVRYLEGVEIISNHSSLKLDTSQAIKNYFIAHRKKKATVIEVLVQ